MSGNSNSKQKLHLLKGCVYVGGSMCWGWFYKYVKVSFWFRIKQYTRATTGTGAGLGEAII